MIYIICICTYIFRYAHKTDVIDVHDNVHVGQCHDSSGKRKRILTLSKDFQYDATTKVCYSFTISNLNTNSYGYHLIFDLIFDFK